MLSNICQTTKIPILLDGDTGYGNFNNMETCKKLEQIEIAESALKIKFS